MSYFEFIPAVIPNATISSNGISAPLLPGTLPVSLQQVFVVSRENPGTIPSAPQPSIQPTYTSPALSYADTCIPIQMPNAAKVQRIIQETAPEPEYVSKPILSGYEYVPTIINKSQDITIPNKWKPLPVTTLPTHLQEVFVVARENPGTIPSAPQPSVQPTYRSPALSYADTCIPIQMPNAAKVQRIVTSPPPEPVYVSRALPETSIVFPSFAYDYSINPSLFSVGPVPQPGIQGIQPLVTYSANQPLYASAFDTNLSASNWWRFPAEGTVSFGNNAIIDVSSIQLDNAILSATADELLVNGTPLTNSSTLVSTVTNWASFPATTNINCQNFEILSTTSIQLDNVFLSATPYELLINGIPVVTSTALASLSSITDWALYSAISSIDCDSNVIINCKGIELNDRNVITSTGNLLLVNGTNPVESWSSYKATSNINVNSNNINNANQLNFLTAVPGPLTTGATINALNSLNFSYATALLQQAGITNLNNIAFWNPQYPGVPAFEANMYTKVLTYAGDAGTTYIATDTNVAVPRLFLGGLLGTAGGKLEIIGDGATYVTVNGTPCPQTWSQFRATQAVDFNTNQATRCGGIDFTLTGNAPFNLLTINAGGFLTAAGSLIVTSPASGNVNLNNFGLTRVRDINFNGAGKLLATNVGGKLTYDGQVITTGPEGSASNWAQYNANHNVVIPPAYNFSMNPNNSVTFFPDCTLNANIYHGESGSLVAPDFISFPTTFQVGTTINPAREITMTAGAEGFGINSLTEVNIDATALVNIYSDGIVSIEAIADINLAGVLATFDFGEFNIGALATTFEVASFDVVSVGNVSIGGTVATFGFGATTIGTAALGITAAATVIGVATWNLTSAGNVTTVGTQIGFTAATKFETLSSGDTNLVANSNMNIKSLKAINLEAPIVNIANASISTLTVSTLTARDVNAYNLSSVNLYVESMFTPPGYGQINCYDNFAASRNITCQQGVYAPFVAASTIYGQSGASIDGNLWLEAPLVTATNNVRVTNTLYSDDARFQGQTTISSIQSFVGAPVTFNNQRTDIPNTGMISSLIVSSVNGESYPPPLPPIVLNPSGYATSIVSQTLTTTPTLYNTLTLTFTATSTGYTMITGVVTISSSNGANWTASAEIDVNGVPSGNINSFTNTGNGHLTQIVTTWRIANVSGTSYTVRVLVSGSATVAGVVVQGNLSFISGLI